LLQRWFFEGIFKGPWIRGSWELALDQWVEECGWDGGVAAGKDGARGQADWDLTFLGDFCGLHDPALSKREGDLPAPRAVGTNQVVGFYSLLEKIL